MKALLVGYGEIGKSVEQYYGKYHRIRVYDPAIDDAYPRQQKFDILLVAFGYSKNFVDQVKFYKSKYDIENVIIFSTVPMGTTRQIIGAVHSPVEGRHPHLEESIGIFKRYMGGYNSECAIFLLKGHKDVEVLQEPEHTEFLKIQSTTNYGIMLEYARYVKSVCDKLNMDYDYVMDFNKSYNNLYEQLGLPNISRYILTPPEGKIGGHCVVPNAVILNKLYPNPLVQEVANNE